MTQSSEPITRWKDDIHTNWLVWFVLVHVFGCAGIWYAYSAADYRTVIFAVVYFFLGHFSISCGAHRLYAHKTYEAKPVLQYIMLTLFSGVIQGPVSWWSGVHRRHHRHEGERLDVHDPDQYGPVRAHMGWMCTKEGVSVPGNSYLRFGRNEAKMVKWQYEHHEQLMVLVAFVVPIGMCALWGDILGGVLVGVFARLVFQYHFTWIVNSLCHMHGTRVEGGGTATNIPLLGICTFGESYHANHHEDHTDWRLGRNWYDLDPGKWMIWLLFMIGLAAPIRRKTS